MNPNKNSVLILGATGRLGQAAIQAFHANGWQVIAQSRIQPSTVLAGVTYLQINIFDTTALLRAAAKATIVVHALNPAYTKWQKEALPLCRAGMNIAEQLDALFMLPGNIYNFGAGMPAILEIDSPQQPTARKGAIRCAIEAEMRRRAVSGANTGLRSVVIRAGDFFGGGTGNWFDLVIVKSAAKGKLVYPGPVDRLHAWAYLPDLANTFEMVARHNITRKTAGFERFHFAGHSATGAMMLAAIERAINAASPSNARSFARGSLPWGFIKFAGAVVPSWRELSELAYLWTTPHQLSNAALTAKIGKFETTPLDAAVANSLNLLGITRSPAHNVQGLKPEI